MNVPKCASQHFGEWMVYPLWFHQALSAIKAGMFKADTSTVKDEAGYPVYPYEVVDGVAIMPIAGQMQKGDSSFGGTSTIRVRQALRQAMEREDVRAILLNIDSPGGTVAGTSELAADVAMVGAKKKVYAQISDLGASAAYWVASQAERIYANETALVGSLGTVLYVEDTSGAYEAAGVKAYAITTGEYKAAGADGLPVTAPQLEYLQGLVDKLNGAFKRGVQSGRDLAPADVNELFDGRVHVAADAKKLQLIDGVQDFDTTFKQIRERLVAEDARKASRSNRAKAIVRLMEMDD